MYHSLAIDNHILKTYNVIHGALGAECIAMHDKNHNDKLIWKKKVTLPKIHVTRSC